MKSGAILFLACFTQLEGAGTDDFESVNAAVLLLSNESSKTIQIGVKDDDLPEADETFTFNLTVQVKPRCLPSNLCVCDNLKSLNVCLWIDDDPVSSFTPFCPLTLTFFLQSSTALILPPTALNPNPNTSY